MKQNYFIVVRSEYVQLGLKGCDLLVFAIIAGFSTDSSSCTCLPSTMSEMTGYSKKQIYRSIDRLIYLDLIEYPFENQWSLDLTHYAKDTLIASAFFNMCHNDLSDFKAQCKRAYKEMSHLQNSCSCDLVSYCEEVQNVQEDGQNVQEDGQNVQEVK